MPNKTKQNTKNSTEQICSQPLYKSQTTHHTQPTPTTQQSPAGCAGNHHPQVTDAHTVLNVNPTVCSLAPTTKQQQRNALYPTQKRTHTHHPLLGSKHMQAQENKAPTNPTESMTACLPQTGLPRKEVIQPHLPVRLPCYDFVPIANPPFDPSPRTSRLGHGLRVLPTFVT